jgi:hypothetical protein
MKSIPNLEKHGFEWGGLAPLTSQTRNVLRRIIKTYENDPMRLGDDFDRMEDEIDSVMLVSDNKQTSCALDLNVRDLFQPAWMDKIHRTLHRGQTPILARACLHLHNIATDGPLHIDAERKSVRLWNVMISLHDDPHAGATVIFPPGTTEVHTGTPIAVAAPKNNFFVMDGNTLHYRRGDRTTSKRRMFILTFSDRIVDGVDW